MKVQGDLSAFVANGSSWTSQPSNPRVALAPCPARRFFWCKVIVAHGLFWWVNRHF